MQKYKIIDGTSYPIDTPDGLVNRLEGAKKRRERLAFVFGNTGTGRPYDYQSDNIGYIGRSTGVHKVALCLFNSRSSEGSMLDTDRILEVRTSKGKKLLWRHPAYQNHLDQCKD